MLGIRKTSTHIQQKHANNEYMMKENQHTKNNPPPFPTKNKSIEKRPLDKGAPTATSGEEYGIKRRFKTLLELTSFKGKRILDIGCGFGAYSLAAEKYGAEMSIGVEINQEYIKNAVLDYMILADAHTLPFRDSYFDIILMIEVLEHLPNEIDALKECKRILKKNGLLFISVPNKFYPFETHGMRIGYIDIQNILGIGIPFLSWMPKFVRES